MEKFKDEALQLATKIISNEMATITQHQNEEGEIIAITLAVSSEAYREMEEKNKDWALSCLGVDEKTLEYFKNSKPEERDHITRLAKRAALKAELSRLESEITKSEV
jgi:hypothetical protein